MEHENGGNNLVAGLLVGFVFGVAVGLICAPQSGQETRSMLKDKATVLKEKATELKEKASEMAEEVKDKVSKMKRRTEQAGPECSA